MKTFLTTWLLLVADVVDANFGARTILDRFIARYVGRTQNRHFSVVRFTRLDRFERQPGQNGTNRSSASVGFRNARRDADVFVSAFYKERGGHPFAVFFSNGVDDIEVIIDLGRAEIQSRSILMPSRGW